MQLTNKEVPMEPVEEFHIVNTFRGKRVYKSIGGKILKRYSKYGWGFSAINTTNEEYYTLNYSHQLEVETEEEAELAFKLLED